jgi:hypothetical protein
VSDRMCIRALVLFLVALPFVLLVAWGVRLYDRLSARGAGYRQQRIGGEATSNITQY